MGAQKYAVFPGVVVSKNDGKMHFVRAQQLMNLYGVRPEECLVIHDIERGRPWYRWKMAAAEKLISLRPRQDGDYTLPTS